MKVPLKWLLTVAIGLAGFSVHAQRMMMRSPAGFGRHGGQAAPTAWHRGFVVKITGDTVRGLIQTNSRNLRAITYRAPVPNKYDPPNERQIKRDSIAFMRLFDNRDNIDMPGHTDYVRVVKDKKLYRVLFRGKVSVFDESVYSDEIRGYVNYNGMLIVKGADVATVTSVDAKKKLVAIINEFFGKNFSKDDFKSANDALAWIREHSND